MKPNPQPYSVPQVLANLKQMARTHDLEWIGQVANDIVQRGIEDTNTDLVEALKVCQVRLFMLDGACHEYVLAGAAISKAGGAR